MRRILIIAALVLAGCGNSPPPAEPAQGDAPVMSGAEAYEQQCAGCHETGINGAPVVGNKEDWKDRSKLWQAVIMAHARNGYFDMPAKGGRPDLPDETIDAAVEHMLKLTYPEMPPDQ